MRIGTETVVDIKQFFLSTIHGLGAAQAVELNLFETGNGRSAASFGVHKGDRVPSHEKTTAEIPYVDSGAVVPARPAVDDHHSHAEPRVQREAKPLLANMVSSGSMGAWCRTTANTMAEESSTPPPTQLAGG
jgi:hypothetical protein